MKTTNNPTMWYTPYYAMIERLIAGRKLTVQEERSIVQLLLYGDVSVSMRALPSVQDEVGTFTVADREEGRPFLTVSSDQLDFRTWVQNALNEHIPQLPSRDLISWSTTDLTDLMINILGFEISNGVSFKQMLPYQLYSDIMRRLVALAAGSNPTTCEIFVHPAAGWELETARALSSAVSHLPLDQLLLWSALAGQIGLHRKSRVPIKTSSPDIDADYRIAPVLSAKQMFSGLDRLAKSDFAIDDRNRLLTWLQAAANGILVWFTDDLLETGIDTQVLQAILKMYPLLRLKVIPRRWKYGNDCSYDEFVRLLELPSLNFLRSELYRGRMEVISSGPLLAAVDPRALSTEVREALDTASIAVFKGARTFETMHNVNNPSVYLFSVAYEFTESLTGLDSSNRPPILVCRAPQERLYSGFQSRHQRRLMFPNGREAFLAETTTYDIWTDRSRSRSA